MPSHPSGIGGDGFDHAGKMSIGQQLVPFAGADDARVIGAEMDFLEIFITDTERGPTWIARSRDVERQSSGAIQHAFWRIGARREAFAALDLRQANRRVTEDGRAAGVVLGHPQTRHLGGFDVGAGLDLLQ